MYTVRYSVNGERKEMLFHSLSRAVKVKYLLQNRFKVRVVIGQYGQKIS